MKVLLTILCALMVLFAGGCGLLLFTGAGYSGMFESLPGVLIFGGIAALNVLVLAALWGQARTRPWVFYTLTALDALVVVALGLIWAGFGLRDSEINLLGGLLVGGFAAKGLLTFFYVRDPS